MANAPTSKQAFGSLAVLFALAMAGCSDSSTFKGAGGGARQNGSETGAHSGQQSGDGTNGGAKIDLQDVLGSAAENIGDGADPDLDGPSAGSGAGGKGDGSSNGKTPTAEELALACSGPAAKEHKQVITFPEPTVSCAWGQDAAPVEGNIAQLDGRISARGEQPASLDLPSGALLCQLGVQFANGADGAGQAMYFDDEIFLTYNGLILTASQKLNLDTLFDKKDDFLVWNWDKLIRSQYVQSNGSTSVYCAGAATGEGQCSIPPTQTNGTIAMTFDDKLIRRVALASGAKFDNASGLKATALADNPAHEFRFITTGDNDDIIDCKHSTFQMSVTAKYVIP